MCRHFWHGALSAAILFLSGLSASATPQGRTELVQQPVLSQTSLSGAPAEAPFQLAQARAKTKRDVERERSAIAKKKARKPRKRRARPKPSAAPVNAPPPLKKPLPEDRIAGPGVSLSAALITGGRPLSSGVVWTLEPLTGDNPPTVTTDAQPIVQLPAGRYRITAKLNAFLQSVEVDIPQKGIARLELAFNAARLQVNVLPAEGAMPLRDVRIRILKIGVDGAPPVIDTRTAAFDNVLPAGIYRVEASQGLARVSEDIGLTAGANRKVQLNLSVGYVRARARSAPGREFLPNVVYELLPDDGLDLEPKPLAKMSGEHAVFTMPAGTYRVLARYGEATGHQLVNVGPNTFSDIVMDLDAGQAIVTLEGLPEGAGTQAAFRLIRHDGTDGASLFLSRTGPMLDVGLPVGSYTVEAELPDGRQANKPFIIEPGIKTEVRIKLGDEPDARLTLSVGMAGGGPLPQSASDHDVSYSIVPANGVDAIASGKLDGSLSLDLAKGQYKITALHGATGQDVTSAISLKPGADANVQLEFSLGTATLALSDDASEGAAEWVFSGIDGKEVARHSGHSGVLVLKPGEYVVALTVGDTAHTAALSITAGQNTAVKLPVKTTQ